MDSDGGKERRAKPRDGLSSQVQRRDKCGKNGRRLLPSIIWAWIELNGFYFEKDRRVGFPSSVPTSSSLA